MARQTLRRRMWTGVGLVAALTGISVGAWGLQQWAPFASDPVHVVWPKNVQPLVDFVQGQSQLRFVRPVQVEFIADTAAFQQRVQPVPTPSQHAVDTLHIDESVGRALGFWSNNVDLVAATATVRSAGDFSSAWLHADNTVVVRATGADAALSPSVRADLVVTLTQVLDDQQFRVADRLAAATSAQAFQALSGLDLGQALWVQDRYVRRFDNTDTAAFDKAAAAQRFAYGAKVGGLPPAFRALRIAAQRIGPAFVTALQQGGGTGAIAAAFTRDTPVALDQLTMPGSKYRRRDHLDPVKPPPLPVEAELRYHRQLGPFGVYLVLAAGLPPTEALTAADGWGNDAFTAYRLNGRVCVDGRIVADSPADADRIERALNAWGHARPKQTGALVGRKGTTLLLSACDPGIDVTQPTVSQAAIDQFFGRADVLRSEIISTGQPEFAECVAVSAFQRYSARDVRGTNPDVDSAAILDAVAADCNSSV